MYLARQTRQDAKATEGEAMASWRADYNNLCLEILRAPDNAQNLHLQLENGTMNQGIADQILEFNAAMLNSKGGLDWWATARPIWRPAFVDHMDRRIAEARPVTDTWPWFSTGSTAYAKKDGA